MSKRHFLWIYNAWFLVEVNNKLIVKFAVIFSIVSSSSHIWFINVQCPCVVTASDVADDVRSLQRKLDRKLVLLVKQKLGTGEYWYMPMGIHTEGETMRKVEFHSIYVHSVIIVIPQ